MADEHDRRFELIDHRRDVGGVGAYPAKGTWRRENRVLVTVETVEHGAPARGVCEGAVNEDDRWLGHASEPAPRVLGSRPWFAPVGCTCPARARDQGSPRARTRQQKKKHGCMIILRFKIYPKPEKRDELMAALAEIIPPARATEGVITFDIARVLLDPDAFIATAVYEDGAALERQESLAEVGRVMSMLPESLVAPPERTIFDASVDPTLV